jgi:hypothetical protein
VSFSKKALPIEYAKPWSRTLKKTANTFAKKTLCKLNWTLFCDPFKPLFTHSVRKTLLLNVFRRKTLESAKWS